jgi:hypothetical protein
MMTVIDIDLRWYNILWLVSLHDRYSRLRTISIASWFERDAWCVNAPGRRATFPNSHRHGSSSCLSGVRTMVKKYYGTHENDIFQKGVKFGDDHFRHLSKNQNYFETKTIFWVLYIYIIVLQDNEVIYRSAVFRIASTSPCAIKCCARMCSAFLCWAIKNGFAPGELYFGQS